MADKNWITVYPGALDNQAANMPSLVDNTDRMLSSQIHTVRDIALELEQIIGSDGEEAGSIRKRISDLESATGTPAVPTGPAGGNLSGTYPNPTVAKIQGVEVDSTPPSVSEVLSFNGTKWAPASPGAPSAHTIGGISHTSDTLSNLNSKISDATLDDISASRPPSGVAAGDLSGTYPNPTVAKIRGQTIISSGTPNNGDVLKYSGGQWQYLPVTAALNDLSDTKITAPVDGYFIQYNASEAKFLGRELNLNNSNDVSITSPADGEILKYNNSISKWENQTDFSETIDGLLDVTVTSPTDGYFIQYNSTSAKFLGRELNLNRILDVNNVSVTDGDFFRYNSTSGKWENQLASLNDLSDVSITSPSDGYFIQYNSLLSKFIGQVLNINNIYDINTTSIVDGQVLTYNNSESKWVNQSLPDNNTLDSAYDQGGYGFGRTIVADAGPVAIDAYGDAALELDGYITLDEITEPSPLSNAGLVYTKDADGYTELFYLDNYGNSSQITNNGEIRLERILIYSDDNEFTEAGSSFSTKKTFRFVRDSEKKPTKWRLLLEMWRDGGSGSAECQLEIGSDNETVSSSASSSGNSALKTIDILVNESNEPIDTFLTININIRAVDGATNSHIKYTDLYAIY